ncbi:hypothetical protein F3Y22_tig00113726pilonHSYRG00030 [Hibiscus syriacus]|uniref:Uncharacterized protein n=1 Tax=Hibiscus syriacus TaxID=106335 RepID=A0A6A2X2R0_HIBSY|nr:hypothetical protein F3Y22_tig00113726pilonHSYRG00030 [Hibiscus syriacus]
MTCSCVPKENCVGLDRPLADNAGIKEGVLVPEGGIEKVSVGLFEPKEVLGVQAHKVTKSTEQASFYSRKKVKVDDKANDDGGSNLSFVPRKGKKTELSGSHAETDAIGAKEEMDKDYSSRGRKMKSKQASDNNSDDSGKEDTNTVSAKRKEDPNTVIGAISRNDSFLRERKKSKETMTKATGNPVISERNEISEVHAEQEASNESRSLTPKLYLDRITDLAKAETPANEVLVAVSSIALSTQYQRDNGSFKLIVEFYLHSEAQFTEMDLTTKCIIGSNVIKRESPDFSALSSRKTYLQLKTQKPKPYKPKRKQTVIAAVLKKNDKEADEDNLLVALFVTFGPGSSLPTKVDLIRIYSRYGALDMEDTDMFYNNFCSRIAFLRTSDTEEAFSSSQNDSPFGSANVSFRLRLHLTALSQNHREIPTSKNSSLVEDGIE